MSWLSLMDHSPAEANCTSRWCQCTCAASVGSSVSAAGEIGKESEKERDISGNGFKTMGRERKSTKMRSLYLLQIDCLSEG